jgi:hypothetical protein
MERNMDASFDDSFWLSSTTGAGGAAAFFVTALDIVERGALTYSRRPHTRSDGHKFT